MTSYDDTEAPLDPAAARLRRKLVRLLFVSGGIMMLGLIAVFGAIVYKLNQGGRGGQAGFRRLRRSRAALPFPPASGSLQRRSTETARF